MKRILLSFAFLFSVLIATAQDACLNDVVNTLKDRISLAGYAQVGYTYDDADDGSNTFDIKRVIFMAQGKITDRWLCYFMYSFANTGKILEAYTEYKFLPQLTARIGQFTEYEENKSLGKELYGAIADLVKEYDSPVCFNFPVGHVSMNLPMINGAEVTLETGRKEVKLSFNLDKE